MDWDEATTRKPQMPKFELMSIEDLQARIAALEEEIGVIREVIRQKESARGAADSFFRK